MQLHLLVIDDDPAVLQTLREVANETRNLTFVHADSPAAGMSLLDKENADLILLNPKTHGTSGDGIIRSIRAESDLPMMVLCEKPSEEEVAYYVDAGADAVLSKPLSILELKTRAKAICRRVYKESKSDISSIGNLCIHLQDFTVTKDGKPIKLTKTEFAILKLLVQDPKRVYTKAELFKLIWDYEDIDNGNIINVHIRRMRLKLEDDPANPTLILTRWGFGYQIGTL